MKTGLIDAASDTIGYFFLAGHADIIEEEGVGSALVAGDGTADLINRGTEDTVVDVITAGSAVSSTILSEGSSRAKIAGAVEGVAGNAGDNELRAGEAGVDH